MGEELHHLGHRGHVVFIKSLFVWLSCIPPLARSKWRCVVFLFLPSLRSVLLLCFESYCSAVRSEVTSSGFSPARHAWYFLHTPVSNIFPLWRRPDNRKAFVRLQLNCCANREIVKSEFIRMHVHLLTEAHTRSLAHAVVV